MTPYDALIIGAGHNGLVTAAYLARAGLRVLALERRPVVGGSCVTEEVWPGYRVSTAAYLCGLLQPRIINDLDLGYFGYEILPKDPAFFSPFQDGRRLFIWRDDHQTAEEIARFSQADARRYADYEAFLARLASFVEPWLLTTPPDVLRRTWGDLWQLGRLGLHTVRLPPRTLAQALRLLTQSARDFLDAWFDSPELKAGLWGFVRGGMGAISEALAAAARSHGAEVRTGVEVAEVLVREGRARGVVLAGGEE